MNLCKYIHLTDKMRATILNDGYDKIKVDEIFNMSLLKVDPLVKGLMSMDLIRGKNPE